MKTAFTKAGEEYERYVTLKRIEFRNTYTSTCLNSPAYVDLKGDQYEYHYTLYYYDQAGNLVKTVPPAGVKLLNEKELENLDLFKALEPVTCTTPAAVPITVKNDILTAVSTQLQTPGTAGQSMELWLHGADATASRHVRFVTPDNKYMYQAAIKDDKLWIEFYSLTPGTGGTIDIALSNQAYADISSFPALMPWTHLMIKAPGAGLLNGTLEVYLDSRLVTLTTLPAGAPGYPFDWEVMAGTSSFTLPTEDIASLKHLRIYNTVVTTNDLLADYKNSCLGPVNALDTRLVSDGTHNIWGRFNIPAGGGDEYAARIVLPDHTLATTYQYNSLNQVVKQTTPDAGSSQFWYDRLGRLTVSQNAEQLAPSVSSQPANRYSYTIYDKLGRIKEVGEKYNTTGTVNEAFTRGDETILNNWLEGHTNRQVTITAYDEAPTWAAQRYGGVPLLQRNLRKRVAATALVATGRTPSATERQAASYYSYDINGNVDVLVQENKALADVEKTKFTNGDGLKELKYDYDLVSGKVNKVSYQHGKWDQYYYAYKYDGENRLIEAYSTHNPSSISSVDITSGWKLQARYNYYLHGPLARMELGNQVQGLDYAYTLQGWLKGVNGQFLDPSKDMGADGHLFGSGTMPRDAYGFSLGYYTGDYASIANAAAFKLSFSAPSSTSAGENGKELFNGNISNSVYAISNLGGMGGTESANTGKAAIGYAYRYDQLNRLKGMRFHPINAGVGFSLPPTSWSYSNKVSNYREEITYDANGNIKTYLRNSGGTTKSGTPILAMDDLSYGYTVDNKGRLVNNKLRHVKDGVDAAAASGDIDNQADDNYSYDAVGNLIGDAAEGIAKTATTAGIDWTVYGKMATVRKGSTTINYGYDAGGQRITKSITGGTSTYYVRDAQGNIMGVYHLNVSSNYSWAEQHLYGSSRLGMLLPAVTASGATSDAYNSSIDDHAQDYGKHRYELANHLGNVLVTISDKKSIYVDANGNY